MSEFSNPAQRSKEAAVAYTSALERLLGAREPLTVMRELVPSLRALLLGLEETDLQRPEAPGKWSILQVLDHLTDQEIVNSFRFRSVVAEEEPPLRGYDQDRWSARLRYGAARAGTVLAELGAVRARNLRLLEALDPAELDRVGHHSERGPESVRRIMMLTAGHDLVHRRQIERIRAALGKLSVS
jgi:hypothetical protein